MFANRLHLERTSAYNLVSFGFVNESGALLDSYACVLTHRAVDLAKQSLVQYLGRLPKLAPIATPSWLPSVLNRQHDAVDFIHMSHLEKDAEICFAGVAHGPTLDALRGKEISDSIDATAIILIRCPVDLQRNFIEQLYV
jgi:hypothetical protein